MAQKKITDLPTLPAADVGDYYPIVDSSSNTTKKVAAENIIPPDSLDGSVVLQDNSVTAEKLKFDGAKLTRSSSQSIPNTTVTNWVYNSEVYDTSSYHDNTTNPDRITIPRTGYYSFVIQISWDSYFASGRMIFNVRRNGGPALEIWDGSLNGSGEPSITLTYETSLTANDYLTFDLYQDTGSPRGLSPTSYVAVKWLGS